MKPRVSILDYGSGNVQSVRNLITYLGHEVTVSNRAEDIANCTHLILPGVGAFGTAMRKIHELLPLDLVKQKVFDWQKPFLGICVGMQILADKGNEFGEHYGLGWIPGTVQELDSKGQVLPHIGWNDISPCANSPLLEGIGDARDFYFVHSYAFAPKNVECVIANAEYGSRFPAIVQQKNIYGVQFHPEKSQKAGQRLMLNFLGLE